MKFASRRYTCAVVAPGRAYAPTAVSLFSAARFVNVNPSMQRKQTTEFYNSTKFTDFDIDKEKWGKQQQWHTMDCVLDPSVTVPSKWSVKGLRSRFGRWLTMKKVLERRPGFLPEIELRQTYLDYKKVAYTSDPNQLKNLCKHTTWTEATRIEAETKKAQLEAEHKEAAKHGSTGKVKSWKDLSVKPKSVGEVNAAAAAPSSSPASSSSTDATAAAAGGEDAVDLKTPLMEIKIDSFEITNLYIGQMTNEDWVQITAQVKGKYRTPKTAPIFEPLHEFPVFELKMGDGVNSSNTNPFIVVAIMDRDGARYGKDGNDAVSLRKSLAQSKKSWFNM